MAQVQGLGKRYLKAFFKGFFVAVPVTVTFLDRVACVARVEGASMQVLLEISLVCQEIKKWLSTDNTKVEEKLFFLVGIKWPIVVWNSLISSLLNKHLYDVKIKAFENKTFQNSVLVKEKYIGK